MDLSAHRRIRHSYARARKPITFRRSYSPSRRASRQRSLWIWRIPGWLMGLLLSLVVGMARFLGHRRIGRFAIPLLLIGSTLGLIFFLYIVLTLPDPTIIVQRRIPQSTKIYDRTSSIILYDIHNEFKRTSIALEDVPKHVKEATIVAEDKDFYAHQGFDLRGVARAIIKDIFTLSKAQGGSTITQQLVKNALLTNEKTVTRKMRELLLAYEIERRFSKDQILKMYLNEIPYGKLAYGIEAASRTYFNKSAKDLTIAEGAVLAALPKAPSYYSPFGSHRDDLIGRQRYIVSLMRQRGTITEEQERESLNQKLLFANPKETIIAPHFVFYVRDLLEKEFGESVMEDGGLKVVTTLDMAKQKIAEEAVSRGEAKLKQYNATNAALISLDPATGQILAMIGSRDYFNDEIDGKVNVATRPRQPGSSFKPIVYATAFEKGYTPDTILYDVITTFKNIPEDYTPQNYTGKTYGPVTMRQALAGSLNIPAVKTLYLTGVDRVLDKARVFGYSTLADRSRFSLSLVLGGGEVTLLEHTSAFGAFAQDGIARPTSGILRVEDSNGQLLKEFREASSIAVEPQIARLITSILSDNAARAFIFGANNLLTLADRPVAAKTGTTNDNRDAWLLGYTPSLVTGVWVGNNNNKEMKKGADGSVVAAPIWNEYMRRALEGTPVQQFTSPDPISVDKPILRGERAPTTVMTIDRVSGKLATDRTPEADRVQKKFFELHSVLHWVNKDDPRGSIPSDPASDPQYRNWEDAVVAWGKTQTPAIANDPVPTEYDDVHVPENIPEVRVSGIVAGQTVTPATIPLTISITARRPIIKVDIIVGQALATTIIDSPISSPLSAGLNLETMKELVSGSHTLTIVAYDDAHNLGSASLPFTLQR